MTFKNKTILVTGGTGSFGNYIAKRLLDSGVKEVRILSRDEKKQYDMRIHYNYDERLKFFVGDIRDFDRVNMVMKGVDLVYQAAALKQVPSCESAPFEAVKTNVIGVENVIRSSILNKVEKVICVSTDKAVKPVNVMGMTKAIQERLIINANQDPDNENTKLCVVRYGNVLLSRGSVVPYFRKLLAEGKELTITDYEMTRFLLSLDDAIDLVVYATIHGEGGETFVKKAPAVKILRLAEILSENEGKELKVREIGKFPGEKLHEILITEEELDRTRDEGNYFKVNPWWIRTRFNELKEEYASDSEIISEGAAIRALLDHADVSAKKVMI